MEEIIKILVWPLVAIIFFLIFKKDISKFISKLNLKKIIIGKKFNAVFNQFKPIKEKNNDQIDFFEKVYKKITGAQLKFLEILKESMRNGGRGLNCGYVSRYFTNIIGSKTDRYDGWITPFITAYLQENILVSVSNNFFSLTPMGEDFLDYIEKNNYPLSKKIL